MKVQEIGRVSAETKGEDVPAVRPGGTEVSFSPKVYCIDNIAGGNGMCREVFKTGGLKPVTNYTLDAACETSPGVFVNCI